MTRPLGSDLVYALAAADGLCFAARESGLYRSDDGGETWHSTYDSLHLKTRLGTTALALSPTFKQDRTLFAGVSGGVLRSTDAGEHWSITALPDPPPIISALVLSPAFGRDGFALATSFRSGTFYSTDSGDSWQTGNFSLIDKRVLAAAISPNFPQDRTALIGTESGVFSSSNGARSWDVVDLPYVAATSVAYAPNGVAHAGTDGDGMYTSTDNGVTWARSTLEYTLSINLVLAPTVSDLFVFAEDALYHSIDGGATWTLFPLHTSVTAAMLLDPATLLIGYLDGTISRRTIQS